MGFNISRRFKDVSYLERGAPEGAEPFRATIRTNLTASEVEGLRHLSDRVRERVDEVNESVVDPEMRLERRKGVIEDMNAEFRQFYAPFVTAWNLEYEDDGGDVTRLPLPSTCDGDTFRYVPDSILELLYADIQRSSVERIDPKRSSVSKSTDETRVGSN